MAGILARAEQLAFRLRSRCRRVRRDWWVPPSLAAGARAGDATGLPGGNAAGGVSGSGDGVPPLLAAAQRGLPYP